VHREPDLDEVGHHRHLLSPETLYAPEHGQRSVGRAPARSYRQVEPPHQVVTHALDGKCSHRPSQVTTFVAVLKATDQHRVDGGARHNAKMSEPRHGVRQPPAGHADAHAALDDARIRRHRRHCRRNRGGLLGELCMMDDDFRGARDASGVSRKL
jgi:hypothetical protein